MLAQRGTRSAPRHSNPKDFHVESCPEPQARRCRRACGRSRGGILRRRRHARITRGRRLLPGGAAEPAREDHLPVVRRRSTEAAQDMQELNTLPQVNLSVSARRVVDPAGPDATRVAVSVQNKGSAVAAMTVLSLRRAASGDRVLPSYYSDNYIWLLPGESRDFTIACATSALAGQRPAVRVAAYNSAEQTIRT